MGKTVPIRRGNGWQLGEVQEPTYGNQHLVSFPDGIQEEVRIALTPFSDYLRDYCKKRPRETNNADGPFQDIFEHPFDNPNDHFLPPSSPIVTKRRCLEDRRSNHDLHPADWVLDSVLLANKLSPLRAPSPLEQYDPEDILQDLPTATVTPLEGTPARAAATKQTDIPGLSTCNRNSPAQSLTSSRSCAATSLLPHLTTPGRSTPRRKRNDTPRKALPKIWTIKEDSYLTQLVQNGTQPTKWSEVALEMGDRTGKQCRERYLNHLTPKLRVEQWSPQEDAELCKLYLILGTKWALMAKILKGRTDNNIKNRFHHLRRRLEKDVSRIIRNREIDEVASLINVDAIRRYPLLSETNCDFAIKARQIIPYLAADTVKTNIDQGQLGPFVQAYGESCTRCNFIVPSVQTGVLISTQTGWCESCAKVPAYVAGDMLRQCLYLRRDIREFE